MRTQLLHDRGDRRNIPHHVPILDDAAKALSPGGRVIYIRTRRPVETCNAIAEVAGLGEPVEG